MQPSIAKHIAIAIVAPLLVAFLACCHHIEEYDNDVQGNFEALWTVVDEHYCFFADKDVDWDEVHARYSARLYPDMPRETFFKLCAEMLDELKDGHVNLSSWFNTSYYTKWWSDYPQNYDRRLVQEHYLHFDYRSLGVVDYAILDTHNIGYISYPTFAGGLGHSNIEAIIGYFSLCTGIIIDLRDNGGGDLTNVNDFLSHFVSERTLAGFTVNKTGPGHNDFSEPYPYYIESVPAPYTIWNKPVVVLTNRSTFSAANNFVAIARYLPNFTIVGDRTGGGSGMPMSFEIPCGWSLRLSAVSLLDAKGLSTEAGIEPADGCKVDLDPELALQGVDTMLEKAIEIIKLPPKIN